MKPLYIDIETLVSQDADKNRESKKSDLSLITGKVMTVQTLYGSDVRIFRPTVENIKQLQETTKQTEVIGHNLSFDLGFLKYNYGIVADTVFDVMIAEATLSGGAKTRSRGVLTLEALAKQYLGIELNKDHKLRTSFNKQKLTPEQIEYAAMDVMVLPEIHQQQVEKIKDAGLEQVIRTEMRCVPATIWLELSGMPIDLTSLEKVKKKILIKQENAQTTILQILKESGFKQLGLDGNPTLNLGSAQQLLSALKSIGLNIKDTDDNTLLQEDHRIISPIIQYREYRKLITSFLNKYPSHVNSKTGRIHPNFNQYGANTGRFTCSDPNMQQVPRDTEIRGMFKANNGNVMVIGDYNQIELRILAEISQEPKFIDVYRTGGDLHKQTAALILNKTIEEVTKEERQQAKTVNFGFAYGQGAKGFKEKSKKDGIDFTLEQALKHRTAFFHSYPVLDRYLKMIASKAVREHKIINNAGRHVVFTSWQEGWQYENNGRNAPIQSLNTDIIKTAMGNLYSILEPQGVKLVNCVHDELVFEVESSKGEEISAIIRKEMIDAGKQYIKTIPVGVDVKISDRWIK